MCVLSIVEIVDCPEGYIDWGYSPGVLHHYKRKLVAEELVCKNVKTRGRIFVLANEGFAGRRKQTGAFLNIGEGHGRLRLERQKRGGGPRQPDCAVRNIWLRT